MNTPRDLLLAHQRRVDRIRTAIDALDDAEIMARQSAPWSTEEDERLRDRLFSEMATSFRHQRQLLAAMAVEFKRPEADIKRRAILLGRGSAVDQWLNDRVNG